jgi:tetratricopeptide (TPR) repeat protein
MRAVRGIVLSVCFTVAFFGALPRGLADDDRPIKPEAKARYKRGLEYYKMKEYEAAISEFEAAYAIDPRNEIMFAQAQAERLSGDCASAVVLYRRFLETNPPAVHAEAARTSLDKCEVALHSTPEGDKTPPSKEPPPPAEPPPVEPTSGVSPAPVEPAPASPREGRPFWKDPLGDAFALGGVASLGVGVGFYLASSSDASAADDAPSYSEHARLLDRAEQRRTIALVGLGAGSALLVGAAVRWFWPGPNEKATQVALDLRGDGAGLIVGGSF